MHKSYRRPLDIVRLHYTYLNVVNPHQGVQWNEVGHSTSKATITQPRTPKDHWRLRWQDLTCFHCVHGKYVGLCPAAQRPLSLRRPSLERNPYYGPLLRSRMADMAELLSSSRTGLQTSFVVKGLDNRPVPSTLWSTTSDRQPVFSSESHAGGRIREHLNPSRPPRLHNCVAWVAQLTIARNGQLPLERESNKLHHGAPPPCNRSDAPSVKRVEPEAGRAALTQSICVHYTETPSEAIHKRFLRLE